MCHPGAHSPPAPLSQPGGSREEPWFTGVTSEGTSDGTEQQKNSRAALGQQDLLFQKEPSCSVQFLELAAKSLPRLGWGMSPHTAATGASQAP